MTIHERILAVRREAKFASKSGSNEHQRYKYTMLNDVIKEVRELCNKHGIYIYPATVERGEPIVKTKADRGSGAIVTGSIVVPYTIDYVVAGEDGDSITISVSAAGEDAGDKFAYKANTGALKYALLQLFMLATLDDAEADSFEFNHDVQVEAGNKVVTDFRERLAAKPEDWEEVKDEVLALIQEKKININQQREIKNYILNAKKIAATIKKNG